MKRTFTLQTSLTGNFRLLIVEERFDQKTGERFLYDEAGKWRRANSETDASLRGGIDPEPQ